MDFYSPLRYPGGKAKVSEYFKTIFNDNMLYGGEYVEPYAGGASVALSLLFNEYVSKIIINDIDKSIYSFWYSVLNHTDKLCKKINDTPITTAIWEKQKKIQKEKDAHNEIDLGFSTFFLNRTNRSGILNAGIIGGKEQLGEWKIDARFNKKDLISRIQKIAYYKADIELHNEDAVKLVKKISKKKQQKILFYLDPPYYNKGKELYLNYYIDKDHREISEAIGSVKNQKWIVTYDSVPQIASLYKNFRSVKFNLNYSAGKAAKGEELMIFSDNLIIPKNDSINII